MTNSASPQKRVAVWERDLRCCHYCGSDLPLEAMTLDHVVPKVFGGPKTFWNLVASCALCNVKWASTIRKCDCGVCGVALATFLQQRHLHKSIHEGVLGHPMPRLNQIPRRRVSRSVAGVMDELVRRSETIKTAIDLLPPDQTHQAAAMRGIRSGFRQAMDLLQTVSEPIPASSIGETEQ